MELLVPPRAVLCCAVLRVLQVEAALRLGPQRNLEPFLKYLSQLEAAMAHLEMHSSLKAVQEAYAHAEEVGGWGVIVS